MDEIENCRVQTKYLSLDKSSYTNQKVVKKIPQYKKDKSLTSKTNSSRAGPSSAKTKLDVSNYKVIKNSTQKVNEVEINMVFVTNLYTKSESSTGESISKFSAIEKVPKLETKKSDDVNLDDSLILEPENSQLAETLYCGAQEDSFSENMNEKKIENNTSFKNKQSRSLVEGSVIEGIKTVDEIGFILQENVEENTDGDYIWDNSIKIVKYISQGAQAKVYLGLIMETESLVAIKRYFIDYNEEDLNRILEECELVKALEHENIVKYFDVEHVIIEEIIDNYCKFMCRIDIIMEYIEGMNLKEYVKKNSMGNMGLEMTKVKFITRSILKALQYLHENKIIHRDLKPENILVTEDLSEIKIVDFGISTKVKNCETLRNRTILGTAYYMAPEVISEKPYAYEADIWSLGCIVYELVTGIKPYSNLNAVSAMSCMIQYSSPLEQAEEHIQDYFYDKPNRSLLLFLQKCWRPNNNFRPSAVELLDHAFLSE